MSVEEVLKYSVPLVILVTTFVTVVRYFINMEKEIEKLKISVEEVKETLKYIQYNLIDKKKRSANTKTHTKSKKPLNK